ncbi:MAG: Do family serine endopeptidase [Candidatus Kapaibacterium sp.]
MSKTLGTSILLLGVGIFIGVMLVSNIRPDFITGMFGQESPVVGAETAPIEPSDAAKMINDAFVDASDAVLPTVVSISVEMEARGSREEFRDFFRFFGIPEEERRSRGAGSGVIISSDGYIVTNNHVVENATKIEVITSDQRKFKAELIGNDPLTDLAVIKIEESGLPVAHFGKIEKVQIGEFVLAVGNPLGLQSTVTTGIISAIGRGQLGGRSSSYAVQNYIQTDAAINPGNSGGGLFDLSGSLVGINTAIATETGTYIGYGFAIPVDLVVAVINDLIDDGEINRGYIGVSIQTVDEVYAKSLGLDEVKGALVQDVIEGGPADKAGIRPEDVILKVDDREISTSNELQSVIVFYKAGDDVTLTIWRDGKEIIKKVTLQERDEQAGFLSEGETQESEEGEPARGGPVEFENLGFTVDQIDSDIKQEYDVNNGVIVTAVRRYSPASERGLFRGGVITQANRTKIKSIENLKDLIDGLSKGDVLLLRVKYPDRNQIVAMEIPE